MVIQITSRGCELSKQNKTCAAQLLQKYAEAAKDLQEHACTTYSGHEGFINWYAHLLDKAAALKVMRNQIEEQFGKGGLI